MNNKVYEKNMEALNKRFPGMAKVVKEHYYHLDKDVLVDVEYAEDASPILRITKDNRVLYLNGKRNPQNTVKRYFQGWEKLNRATPIFIVGMGNVVLLKYLLEHTDVGINIMVYEPSVSIFLKLMQTVDISIYFENRALGIIVNGINAEECDVVIKSFVNIGNVQFTKMCICPNYNELFSIQVLNYLKTLERITSDIIAGRNTEIRFSSVEANNIFHNIRYLCDGSVTTQLCDVIPNDIPAIIVSAGPSLNKNIKELKKAKNKAFIIAVDTAVRPLVNAGIIPDLYVIVDGKKPLYLLEFEEAKQIPLMASLSSAKDILEFHTGKKIFFNEGITIANNLINMNGMFFYSVACGGSVACSAFSLAYKMGFSTIILVGQDLALTGNKTHADGTFKDQMDIIDTSHCMMVEGNYEKEVPTRVDFKLYLDWFNYYISGCKGIHVINATEGGAKINNTEIMKLKDAIERECTKKINLNKCFENLKPIFNKEQRHRAVAYLNTIPNMFRSIQKDVKKCKRNYEKLYNICNQKTIDEKAYLAILEKIKKLSQKIECHELYSIVSSTLSVADYILASEEYYEEKTLKLEGLEIARKGKKYLELVDECIQVLIPLAEQTVGQMK